VFLKDLYLKEGVVSDLLWLFRQYVSKWCLFKTKQKNKQTNKTNQTKKTPQTKKKNDKKPCKYHFLGNFLTFFSGSDKTLKPDTEQSQ